MNYRCSNLQKIIILCFFAYILTLPNTYNPPPLGWHFHSLKEYSHIAHSTILLLLWNMVAWKLHTFIQNLHLMWMLQTFIKSWKLTKIRMKLQGVSRWNRTFIIFITILPIAATLLYTSWHTKHHSPPHLPKMPLCIPSQFLLWWVSMVIYVNSGFRCEVNKNCTLPSYYAVGSD